MWKHWVWTAETVDLKKLQMLEEIYIVSLMFFNMPLIKDLLQYLQL